MEKNLVEEYDDYTNELDSQQIFDEQKFVYDKQEMEESFEESFKEYEDIWRDLAKR